MTPRIEKYEVSRGRPRGKSHLYHEYLTSIVLIARKHDLDPYQLVDSFIEAWTNKIAHCGSLRISCRTINHDSAIFLIETEKKVIWQFPVNMESLRNPNLLKNRIPTIPIFHQKMKMSYQTNQHISDLKYGMKGVDVKATIIEIPTATRVVTRWGTESYVSNARIADETGSIRLTLWNDYIHRIHVGDKVEIKNCHVSNFAGQSQLRLGRKSTLSIISPLNPEKQI
ncbi:MAG: hypothetical protein ACXACA_06015 [Candidatus Ranarchaeia archaeon]